MKSSFYLPPEWNQQRAILINWPHRLIEWWDPVREAANQTYLAIVKAVALTQSVVIICYDIEQRNEIQQFLTQSDVNMPRVRFFIIPSDDVWTRDYGPITLSNGQETKILNFQFNGWGNKYPAERDNQILAQLYDQDFFPQSQLTSIDFVLEGGSIEVDGEGTLLTTTECLLSQQRNPNFNQSQIESLLKEHLQVKQVLWLEHGHIAGDDTDGHIDTLARFINSETICYIQSRDPTDENYLSLKAMEKQLRDFKNCRGLPYHLVPLPTPSPIFSIVDNRRLPATYANFLITNQVILLPFYDDPQDDIAQNMLESCFPDRQVIGIPSRSLIENYGSVHCITMQIPV